MIQLCKQFDNKIAQIKPQWENGYRQVIVNSIKLRWRIIAVKYQIHKLFKIKLMNDSNVSATKTAIDKCIHEYGDELTNFGIGLFKTTDMHINVTADFHPILMDVGKCHTDLQKPLKAIFKIDG